MSEEIIIDGVNVAGCEFLENENFDGLCLQLYDRYDAQTGCKNKDCYYKQLQRLKQDNEKYMQTLEKIREYLEDIDYIAQFDGTPYDLSVEIKQIITKAEENNE